jgi:microcystin-dependent protein
VAFLLGDHMPIPSSINDLDVNPNNNSPQGSETVGPNANGYLQALGAFIKQIYTGSVKPTATVDFNAQKITNIANGDTSSTSKDVLTGAQVRALAYKVGEQRMWHGAIANIASVWGPGWQLADGTNGTADCRLRFIVGADGTTYAPGATGGNDSVTLSVAQLPAHSHVVNDPTHNHAHSDPGHSHGYSDPGHAHASQGNGFWVSPPSGGFASGASGPAAMSQTSLTQAAGIGITIGSAATGVTNQAAATGITLQNTGTGAAVDIRPKYYASCIIEYTGIGA